MSQTPPHLPYHKHLTPAPSIRHEVGVAFGFIVLMLVAALLYFFLWRKMNQVELKRERDRVERLKAKGLLGADEKSSPRKRSVSGGVNAGVGAEKDL